MRKEAIKVGGSEGKGYVMEEKGEEGEKGEGRREARGKGEGNRHGGREMYGCGK